MKERNEARPGLPPDARAEILEALCSNMEISSDEIVAILKRHHVAEDADVLQDRYRVRSCPTAKDGFSCWSVAGISDSSRASSAASRTRCGAWMLRRVRCGCASVYWSD